MDKHIHTQTNVHNTTQHNRELNTIRVTSTKRTCPSVLHVSGHITEETMMHHVLSLSSLSAGRWQPSPSAFSSFIPTIQLITQGKICQFETDQHAWRFQTPKLFKKSFQCLTVDWITLIVFIFIMTILIQRVNDNRTLTSLVLLSSYSHSKPLHCYSSHSSIHITFTYWWMLQYVDAHYH